MAFLELGVVYRLLLGVLEWPLSTVRWGCRQFFDPVSKKKKKIAQDIKKEKKMTYDPFSKEESTNKEQL